MKGKNSFFLLFKLIQPFIYKLAQIFLSQNEPTPRNPYINSSTKMLLIFCNSIFPLFSNFFFFAEENLFHFFSPMIMKYLNIFLHLFSLSVSENKSQQFKKIAIKFSTFLFKIIILKEKKKLKNSSVAKNSVFFFFYQRLHK